MNSKEVIISLYNRLRYKMFQKRLQLRLSETVDFLQESGIEVEEYEHFVNTFHNTFCIFLRIVIYYNGKLFVIRQIVTNSKHRNIKKPWYVYRIGSIQMYDIRCESLLEVFKLLTNTQK